MSTFDDMIDDHEAILRVRFTNRPARGRKDNIRSGLGYYPITLMPRGEAVYGYDARLLIAELELVLGETYDIPAIFLSPELALAEFPPGAQFTIVEGKPTGAGMVVRHRE